MPLLPPSLSNHPAVATMISDKVSELVANSHGRAKTHAVDSLPNQLSPLPPNLELRHRAEETAKLNSCGVGDFAGGYGGRK
ncbi:hypothetical protein NL676_038025 [Syzygium grande]|nr:hypothetical protein NL676_038025 [Syzygium grande]